jgi:hypothetical protein
MMTDKPLDAFCVYTFVASDDNDDWLKIGIAVPHTDGNGFSITLRALPFAGRLVLRKREIQESQGDGARSLAQQVEDFERAVIERCLLESGGRISVVMARLNIPRRTLNEKMSRLGIDRHRLATKFRQKSIDKAPEDRQQQAMRQIARSHPQAVGGKSRVEGR